MTKTELIKSLQKVIDVVSDSSKDIKDNLINASKILVKLSSSNSKDTSVNKTRRLVRKVSK